MSDDYDVHHPVAGAMREAREMSDQIARQNSGGSRSAFFGEGIGAASGWAVFFGMVGACVGAIMGGVTGAIVGGLSFAAIFGGIAFVGAITRRIWNRGPVILWTVLGAVSFWLLGAAMNSEPINWAVFGAMLGTAFRYLMKDVK